MKRILLAIVSLILPLLSIAQTQSRDDAGQMGTSSGFYETVNPVNFPAGASSWWHLLDVRHSNGGNNYAMQLSGSFFDQNFFLRKTNNNAQQSWVKIVTESDGRVGIGTNQAQSALHVNGNISLAASTDPTNTYLQFQRPYDGYIGARLGNVYSMNGFGGHLVFETNNGLNTTSMTERMRITSAGYVGIGTTNPITPFHVLGNSYLDGNLKIQAKGEAWAEGIVIVRPNGWSGIRFARNDPAAGEFEGNWAMGYAAFSGNDFTISNSTGGVQHDALLHIRSDNQFVGIGTSNPVTRLNVVGGDIKTGNFGNFTGVQFGADANERPRIGFHASDNSRRFKMEMNDINSGEERLAIFSSGGGAYVSDTEVFSVGKGGRAEVTSGAALVDANAMVSTEGLVVKAKTGGRFQNMGAQIEFVIPANTDGSNFYGQGRIITVPGNDHNSDATGKMIFGTKRLSNKVNAGLSWYYGDDMVIDGGGRVGIGTLSPKEALSVNGIIRSKEIKVDAQNWPDYVFAEEYKLRPLPELAAYIKTNNHLPEVPTAKETQENGVSLGDMNKILLKKIEELTLHIISLNEKVNKLAGEIKRAN
ncbi:hypothetical protein [Pedobacter frigidisoli]|uniref:hypothetical protein n=1 Tax=Pedobacter frigidisoli TaxID=2530455 RepID=UPI00292E383C|nr:hypothetical protein [Pedobacter frigidisoli]